MSCVLTSEPLSTNGVVANALASKLKLDKSGIKVRSEWYLGQTPKVDRTKQVTSPQLELRWEGHLDLPGTADRLVGDTESGGTGEEAIRCCVCPLSAARGQRGLTLNWKRIVATILSDVVKWNVEAGGICEVENIEGIPKTPSFLQRNGLY